MVAMVLTAPPRRTKPPSSAASTRPNSKAAAMIAELEACVGGEVSSRRLADVAGCEVKQVTGILKHAVSIGKLDYRVDSHRVAWYQLREDFEGELRKRLLEAASLLRRHGWVVRPPVPGE